MNTKQKLLILHPRSENRAPFLFFPPLLPGIIESLTPNHWDITVVDENTGSMNNDTTFDLAAITVTHNISRAYMWAGAFKARGIPVVLGGRHVSAVPDEALQYADAIVSGNAEPVWSALIADFENGCMKKHYDGTNTPARLASPVVRHAETYFAYALETSRGCPNNCRFCCIHIPCHSGYVRKPAEIVVEELLNAHSDYIFIIDNNFYGNDDGYLFNLFKLIKKNRIRKKLFAAVSTGFFKNPELVSEAARAGLAMTFTGFEADTEQALKSLNKKNYSSPCHIFEEYKNIISLAHKNKILVIGQGIIGLEDDTAETILKRTSFFEALKPDLFSYGILSPMAGSHYFEKFKMEGRLFHTSFPEDWEKYDYMYNTFKHNNLTKTELEKLLAVINRKHMPDIHWLLNSLKHSRSLKTLIFLYAYVHYFFGFRNRIAQKFI